MPADHGGRLHDDEGLLQLWPEPAQGDPENPI